MFGIDDAIIGSAAAGAIGGFITNRSNTENMRETNRFSAKQAELANQFSERMSNTQWQRGVNDMKKAGINPMLAFSKGGASAPQGTSATGQTARVENPFANTSQSLKSASDAILMRKQLESADSQIELNKANASSAAQLADLYRVRKENEELEQPGRRNLRDVEESNFGKYGAYVRRGADILGDVVGAASPIGRGIGMYHSAKSAASAIASKQNFAREMANQRQRTKITEHIHPDTGHVKKIVQTRYR